METAQLSIYDIAAVQSLLYQLVVWRKKELREGGKSKLCIFKIHLVLVATAHKIILLPIEISSSLADNVT